MWIGNSDFGFRRLLAKILGILASCIAQSIQNEKWLKDQIDSRFHCILNWNPNLPINRQSVRWLYSDDIWSCQECVLELWMFVRKLHPNVSEMLSIYKILWAYFWEYVLEIEWNAIYQPHIKLNIKRILITVMKSYSRKKNGWSMHFHRDIKRLTETYDSSPLDRELIPPPSVAWPSSRGITSTSKVSLILLICSWPLNWHKFIHFCNRTTKDRSQCMLAGCFSRVQMEWDEMNVCCSHHFTLLACGTTQRYYYLEVIGDTKSHAFLQFMNFCETGQYRSFFLKEMPPKWIFWVVQVHSGVKNRHSLVRILSVESQSSSRFVRNAFCIAQTFLVLVPSLYLMNRSFWNLKYEFYRLVHGLYDCSAKNRTYFTWSGVFWPLSSHQADLRCVPIRGGLRHTEQFR